MSTLVRLGLVVPSIGTEQVVREVVAAIAREIKHRGPLIGVLPCRVNVLGHRETLVSLECEFSDGPAL